MTEFIDFQQFPVDLSTLLDTMNRGPRVLYPAMIDQLVGLRYVSPEGKVKPLKIFVTQETPKDDYDAGGISAMGLCG